MNREATNAVTSSTIALLAFAGSVLQFIPPWLDTTVESVPRCIFFGIVIAVSIVFHFVFLATAARRVGRSATLWVILGIVFFPIASIVGLIMFGWSDSGQPQTRAG
jgi:quinol-cytochrome oxidoreductase complex cytochrome b subunit